MFRGLLATYKKICKTEEKRKEIKDRVRKGITKFRF
jgi:hypothetical protein